MKSPPRILIVEDERITAEDLRDILTHLGYEVCGVASSGREALAQAGRTAPHLVLMDIRIHGDMDGIATARALRANLDIPVIYLTAHADRDTLDRAKLAAPLGYIVKPFQENELRASIEVALHKREIDLQSARKRESLEAALNLAGEGVITVDAAGVVTLMNSAAETWTGWPPLEAAGQGVSQVLQLKGDAPASALADRAIRLGEVCEIEEGSAILARNGVEIPIGGAVSPVRDHAGQITGAVIVFGANKEEPAPLRAPAQARSRPSFEMVAESHAFKRVAQFARRVAASEASAILIEGESGTGKDVLARFIHFHSRRQPELFLAINCAAIPESLLESELFGYEKGAFTDARSQKKGILELAHGGTVFLDEIGEMPPGLQSKLLRVLEEQCFRRLGGTRDVQVDLRIITATNRDLRKAIHQGRFRLDLYYRLNVIQIVVPPLRDRRDDLLPLANFFLHQCNRRYRRSITGFSAAAIDAMMAHNWPGNVRELRNTIERTMVLEDSDTVQPSSLGGFHDEFSAPPPLHEPARASAPLPGMSLEQAERAMLLGALEKTGWNQTRAARMLSITRDTLRYKMKKWNLRPNGAEESTGE